MLHCHWHGSLVLHFISAIVYGYYKKKYNLNTKLNDLHDKTCFHTPHSTPKIYGRFITTTNTSVSTALPSDGPGAPIMTCILFDNEYGGKMFLQNTGIFLEDYIAAHMTRHYSSLVPTLNLE